MNTQQTPTTTRRPSGAFHVAKILTLVLENGIAHATRQTKPHSIETLNMLRNQLLRDPFFDPDHRTAELAYRTHPESVSFMDMVVLLARLTRVLLRREPLGEEQLSERIAVRNECLDLPFFNRQRANPERLFGEGDIEHEGCFV